VFNHQYHSFGEGNAKHFLCVQVQTSSSPAEVFVFDSYNFVECGSWHHLVITHLKQKLSLYIDAEFVQHCTVSYPTSVTKERIAFASLGRGEANSKKGIKFKSVNGVQLTFGEKLELYMLWKELGTSLHALEYFKGVVRTFQHPLKRWE
jgi:hypothetical protein